MLLPGPLKNIMRGSRGGQPAGEKTAGAAGGPVSQQPGGAQKFTTTTTRPSRGIEEFFNCIRDQSGLNILDLGSASQQNVSFITNLGHRLYAEDFLQLLTESFGSDDLAAQSNSGSIDYFLHQALDYPEGHFDGVLVWDVLEYLAPALLAAVVERLLKIVRPKGYMLAFFHADDKAESVPFYTFRIQDMNSLQVAQSSTRKPAQLFNNRSLERLFGRAEAVKFFLTRDRLREVIVKV
jgi:2-polyprenyl-3-methyl-5-hydroxy-6-metoxy-1,4-benzoquinol methylase